MREADLQRLVMEYLDLTNLVWWRVPLGGVRKKGGMGKNPMAGFPDLCGLTRKGLLWGIELKSIQGRISPIQSDKIDRLRSSGALIAICYDFEQAKSFVNKLLVHGF